MHAVIVALGCAPGLGFVHTGHERSFVFDLTGARTGPTTVVTVRVEPLRSGGAAGLQGGNQGIGLHLVFCGCCQWEVADSGDATGRPSTTCLYRTNVPIPAKLCQ